MRLGDGAELAGEAGLLLGGEGLVPEEDDVMRVQRVGTAATTSRASGAEMSTPEISAPTVGEIGWTLTEVARVTAPVCPTARAASQFPAPLTYIGPPPTAAPLKGAVNEHRHGGSF